MILLTGRGSFASEFAKQTVCNIVSLRKFDDDQIDEVVAKHSVIVHNAANLTCRSFNEAINDNFLLTKRVIDSAYRINPDIRFFYLSSMSILKTDQEYADVETMTPYSFSKYLGEIYCLKHPLKNVSCLRCSTIYFGDKEKDGLSKLVNDAVSNKEITLINSGNSKRDFIPIEIVVQYIKRFIQTQREFSRKYNIASGKSTRFSEIADFLRSQVLSLKVGNNSMNIPDILHEFSTDSLKDAGLIEFDLFAFVKGQIQKLRNE